jgi:hypothetical protein
MALLDGEVLADAIVPEVDRALGPAEAADELGPVAVIEEIVEQRPLFLLRHALEVCRIGVVDVEELPPVSGWRTTMGCSEAVSRAASSSRTLVER